MENLPKRVRSELEPIVGSDVLAAAKGWYHTSLPLNLNNPNLTDTINSIISRMMTLTIRRRKTKTRVFFIVSQAFVTVVDRDTMNTILQIPSYAVDEWVSEDTGNPVSISFTHSSRALKIDYLNIFQIKKKYIQELEDALDVARRAEKLHRKSSVNVAQLGKKPRIVGTRPGRYLGSHPVSSKTGDHVCKEAVDALMRAASKTLLNVAAIISTEGVTIAEILTDEVFVEVLANDISFVTVLNEGKPDEMFAMIEVDQRLDAINCHIVYTGATDADSLCEMIGIVQQHQRQRQEKLGTVMPFKPELATPEPPPEDLKDFTIEREKLTAVKKLGSGQFGVVWLASYDKESSDDSDASKDETNAEKELATAVKMLRTESSDQDVADFLTECQTMAAFDHSNIVQLVGICCEARPWLAVLEMMNFGDIRKVMKVCRHKKHKLTLLEQLVLMEQVAGALRYITDKGFVHMDVAARNILLHTNNVIKISDFGCTSPLDPQTGKFRLKDKVMKLAVRWMAPETLRGSPILFWEKTDIYAFAVFMWEIFTYGVLPFKAFKAKDARDAIIGGLILSQPEECPDVQYVRMCQCWEKEPEKRPTFEAMQEFLRGEIAALREQGEETRDLGDSINKLLTQNIRKMSVKAAIVRRQSMRMTPGVVPSAPRTRGSTQLATMPEVDEAPEALAKGEEAQDSENTKKTEEGGTIKRKDSKSRVSILAGPLATSSNGDGIDMALFEPKS